MRKRIRLGLVIAYALLAGCGATTAQTTTTASTTPTVGPTAAAASTSTPLATPGDDGWVKGGPAFAETVAFASGDPNVAYACGVPTRDSGGTGAVALGVSRDGGRTWQTLATPAKAASCLRIRVSPTNARYVAFVTTSCLNGCVGLEAPRLFFTRDGGTTWATASFPSTVSNCASPLDAGTDFAWAGVTLFATPCPPGSPGMPRPSHFLAASVDGAPFAWVDGSGLLSGQYAASIPRSLAPTGTTVYVSLGASLAKTSDGGATWAHLPSSTTWRSIGALPVPAGAPLVAVAETSDTLTTSTSQLLRSDDGGATWARLPDAPGGGIYSNAGIFEAPNRMVYASFTSPATQPGVYKLPPGAASWTFVAPRGPLIYLDLDAISWDATGAAVALWVGSRGVGGGGLWTHRA